MAKIPDRTWQTITIDIDRATQFSGDDADRYSSLIDLGYEAGGVTIISPTLDSCYLNIYCQSDSATDTVPVVLHRPIQTAQTSEEFRTTAGTGANSINIPYLGGVRYIRIYTSANQTADRSFSVIGTV